jgi:hypothetical protein
MSYSRFEGLEMTIIAAYLRSDFTICNRNFPKGSLVAIRKYEGTALSRTFYTLDDKPVLYRSLRFAPKFGLLFRSLSKEVNRDGIRSFEQIEQTPSARDLQDRRRMEFVSNGGFYPICKSALIMPVDNSGAGKSTILNGDGLATFPKLDVEQLGRDVTDFVASVPECFYPE